MTRKEIEKVLNTLYRRRMPKYKRAILDYCYLLLSDFEDEEEFDKDYLEKKLLMGAENWHKYSYAGFAYSYNSQIAETICTPSELKRYDYGKKCPKKFSDWCAAQEYYLTLAYVTILKIVKNIPINLF